MRQLVEGDDTNEPIADAVRGILDGHYVLSRDLAARNHYPAIDILSSISRTMPDITQVEHRRKAGQVREWLATLRDSEDLVNVGAYVRGSNLRIDAALDRREAVGRFLCQASDTTIDLAAAKAMASRLARNATSDDLRALVDNDWLTEASSSSMRSRR